MKKFRTKRELEEEFNKPEGLSSSLWQFLASLDRFTLYMVIALILFLIAINIALNERFDLRQRAEQLQANQPQDTSKCHLAIDYSACPTITSPRDPTPVCNPTQIVVCPQ